MYKLTKELKNFSYKNIYNVSSKRILVRSCLNVAVDKTGKVVDDTRLQESMPLISELAKSAKTLIITGHLGRPERRERSLSFWNVAELMSNELKKIGVSVELYEDITDEFINKTNEINTGKRIFLLDNIRFFKGEESKNAEERIYFSKKLAELADSYVNDAFADYREAASTYTIATQIPSFIGPLFMREVDALLKFSAPERPYVAVLGGAKLSEKLDALNTLIETADKVLVGGAMAYTLLKAKGIETGNSLIEADKLEIAKDTINKAGDKLVLPIDHLVSSTFSEDASKESLIVDSAQIPEGTIAIDIGPKTIELFVSEIQKAKSVLLNGPMGVFEWEKSALGTKAVCEAVSKIQGYKLTGGGDSIAAINKFGITGFDHVSTGGGAMVSFIAYDKFPTLDVILNQEINIG